MDHAEARERLELAAVEPRGVERLTAGDTPESAALAGHLAGCPSCSEELVRLRRVAAIARDVVRTMPSADLRERTLAFVRDVGRPRGSDAVRAEAAVPSAAAPTDPDRSPVAASLPPVSIGPPARRGGLRAAAWATALAAVVVVAVATTGLLMSQRVDEAVRQRDAAVAAQEQVVAALATVTSWSLRVSAEPDVRRVRLESTTADAATATLLFSPSTGDLVVVADELGEPDPNREFRCWVEIDGDRRPVGRIFFGGGLGYWAGTVEAVRAADDGTAFGISLVDLAGSGGVGEPVLLGRL